jgi:tRNA 5-methylaminomethyl-2-thiouridine biosynthesis bifunctional protein
MAVTIPTARLEHRDGTPFSSEYGDVYHSSHGALAQSRHVFLSGNRLPERWGNRAHFTILETGFGLGVNFLAAWSAWKEDASRPSRLHFISVENRPFSRADLIAALQPLAEVAPLAKSLCAVWPEPIGGFHRMGFEDGRVMLTLLLAEARDALPQLVARADAFFLDGFSPAKNPALWSPEVVRELARLAAPGATLASWTVAGGVRAALSDAGFAVEKREGFASKREMLTGQWRVVEESQRARIRRAAVVGGGLAGAMAAERLALRDWDVDVVDSSSERPVPAAGLLRPVANLRDAVNAQTSRMAFLYALQHYAGLEAHGLRWNRCGILQLAKDEEEAARLAAIAQSQRYPATVLEFVDADRAREIAGRAVRGAGWWIPLGAALSPASLAQAIGARSAARVKRRSATHVERLEREGADWRALDANGRVVAEAPVLIVANAHDAKRLLPDARLALSSVRGQATYLPSSPERAKLHVAVSGNGYIAPALQGGHVVGASFQHDDPDPSVRLEDQHENLLRAESMVPGFAAGLHAPDLGGWTGFRTTVPDRLPVFGATALPGVYCATGLGSRGLLWAPLGAEELACILEGEPLPLPRDLGGAISPRRFLS